MNEQEYRKNFYPYDFIRIATEIFVIPIGASLSVNTKEIGSTFTTADGTKRKDIIKKREEVSFKFDTLLEKDLTALQNIVKEIENSDYETKKALFLKGEHMPFPAPTNFLRHYKKINIETAQLNKYNFAFRKNGLFIFTGITLKING